MGNVVDDIAKNAIGKQCQSDIDGELYSKRRSQRKYKHKKQHLSAPKKKGKRRRASTSNNAYDEYDAKKLKSRGRRDSNISTKSENDVKYSRDVVDQLVVLGFGTEKECIHASALTINYWDINEVSDKLTQIKRKFNKHNKHFTNATVMDIIDFVNNSPRNTPQNEAIKPPKNQLNIINKLRNIDNLQNPKVVNQRKSFSASQSKENYVFTISEQSESRPLTLYDVMDIKHNDTFDDDDYYDINHDINISGSTLDFGSSSMLSLLPESTDSKTEHANFSLFHSDPTNYKYPKRTKAIKFEIRNSISATSGKLHAQKIQRMKDETRISIESTLTEASNQELGKIQDNKMNTDDSLFCEHKHNLSEKSLYKVTEPPLLPAIPQHLLYWNDINSDTDFVICCTGYQMFKSHYKSGVYLYDLNSFGLQYLCCYPDKVFANSMGMAIDYEQHKLHLFGGKGLFGQWLILNIKAKLWDIRKDLNKFKIPFNFNMEHPKCIVIDGSLHIYSKGRFLKYNKRKHRFIELDGIKGYDVKNIEFIFYVKEQQRIYVFGGHNDEKKENKVYFNDIWYCQHNESYLEYKWHRFDVELPYHSEGDIKNIYNAVLGFDHILFLFYHNKNEVWCIDLVKETKYICDKMVDIEGSEHSQMINTNTNITHSLCMYNCGPTHTVLQLNDLISSHVV